VSAVADTLRWLLAAKLDAADSAEQVDRGPAANPRPAVEERT
jgi:hypothetical protein